MSSNLTVVEVFKSIQGEGLHVGTPSVFVRLFGCNLQCAGFGMPEGQKSKERDSVAALFYQYGSIKDLPLVKTGCDSYAAWDKRFKHMSTEMTPKELAYKIVEVNGGLFFDEQFDENTHLVITGGEPLLQKNAKGLLETIDILCRENGLQHITFETNGTQAWPSDFWCVNGALIAGGSLIDLDCITLSISPKMRASGESREKAWSYDAVNTLFESGAQPVLKFVVQDEQDVFEVGEFMEYAKLPFSVPVYLMPVGGTYEDYIKNSTTVANLAMKYGYRYSPRLHIDLFGNSWGT